MKTTRTSPCGDNEISRFDDNLGGNLTYNATSTAEVNASGTAGVEAEAGVIFAKASTSFSVTVGGSWSKSSSWEHSIPAKNKAARPRSA